MALDNAKLANGVVLSWREHPGQLGRTYYQRTTAGHEYPIWNTEAVAISTLRAAIATEGYLCYNFFYSFRAYFHPFILKVS